MMRIEYLQWEGIECVQWEHSITHDGIEYLQWEGIECVQWEHFITHDVYLQWEHCIAHDGNRIFTMGTLYSPYIAHDGN